MIFVRNGNIKMFMARHIYIELIGSMFIFEIVFFYSTISGINNLSPNGVKLIGLPIGFMWQNVHKMVPYLTTTS